MLGTGSRSAACTEERHLRVTRRGTILEELTALGASYLADPDSWVELPDHSLTPLRVWAAAPAEYSNVLQVLGRYGFICTDDAATSSSHVLLDEECALAVSVSHTVKRLNGVFAVLDQRLVTSESSRCAAGVVLSFWEQLAKTPVIPDETLETVMATWDTLAIYEREALLASLPRITRTLVEAATSMENPRLLLKAHNALRRSVRAARLRSLAERGVLRTHALNTISPISSTCVVFVAGEEDTTAIQTAILLTTNQMTARAVKLSKNPLVATVRYLFAALPLRLYGVSVVCYNPPSVRGLLPRPLVVATPARPLVAESDTALAKTSRLAASEALWLKKHTGSRRVVDASPLAIACSTLQGTNSRFPESWFSRSSK